MIIDKVIINNFYCFLGENILEFSKGLNIISAVNSGGKSQLFNAFYWTFFDKIYADVDNNSTKKAWKDGSRQIVCPDFIKEKSIDNEKIECSIEIVLTNEYHLNDEPKDELIEYTFTKKVTYQNSDNSISVFTKPDLTISFVKDGETEFIPQSNQSWFLAKIFPASIRKFMWYQGETMDELYDFSNPTTLKNAINEISYFPMYDNMEKIVKASSFSIDKKVDKELMLQKKLTVNQQNLINDISYKTRNIEIKNESITKLKIEISSLQDSIAEEEHKLKGYDKYRDIKEQLNNFDAELLVTKSRIEDSNTYIKETLINKWMLNGCEDLIKASEKNLNIINDELKSFQKTTNPVPISLPGPEYVEKMITDKICYICERPVLDDTPEYEALVKRLNDFQDNSNQKILQDNYTDLNRSRRRLLGDLPDIDSEIKEKNKAIDLLLKNRTRLTKKIASVYTDSGHDKELDITVGATTASQILSKMQSLSTAKDRKADNLRSVKSELDYLEDSLKKDLIEKEKTLVNIDTNSVESVAKEYIKMFVSSIGQLRSIAYSKLISEIQLESNRLYSLYLGGKTQGEIKISNGISIIDKGTKKTLSDLNTAEIMAQKLAVANAFLSLSEKKMKRAYPIVADAPTSDLDHINTYNLTVNIGSSFDQMIIMSKDYALLDSAERDKLIQEAKIVKYYEFNNQIIDKEGNDSRTNKKTFITTVK
jgi:DNA sulfur modification protein DndD